MNQLFPNALVSAEFARREWRVTVSPDTSIEDMVVPAYWGHVSQMLRPGDVIEVVSEDASFYAEFYVRWSRKLEAAVSLLRRVDLEPAIITDQTISEFTVVFRGSRSKWSILRGREVIKDGFESEGQAKAYLADHLKAMAA